MDPWLGLAKASAAASGAVFTGWLAMALGNVPHSIMDAVVPLPVAVSAAIAFGTAVWWLSKVVRGMPTKREVDQRLSRTEETLGRKIADEVAGVAARIEEMSRKQQHDYEVLEGRLDELEERKRRR